MATYTYDDGSTITNDATPTGWATSATPATDSGIAGWSADNAEAAKLSQFYPQGQPWWQSAATYGFTRAVDAHFAQATVDKTAIPGTYAGQNGKTYAGGRAVGPIGSDGMLLLVVAAGVLYAMS